MPLRRRQMTVMASRITDQSSVCSAVCLHRQQRNIKGPRPCLLVRGNPPVTGGIPSQRDSNAENVFIWWRHNAGIIMYFSTNDLRTHTTTRHNRTQTKHNRTVWIVYEIHCRFSYGCPQIRVNILWDTLQVLLGVSSDPLLPMLHTDLIV